MGTVLTLSLAFIRSLFKSRATLIGENLALRQQLTVYARHNKRPQLRREDRIFWAALCRYWPTWKRVVVIAKVATVIGWHKKGFKALWRFKSKPGRPKIPSKHIQFIKRISRDHPEWGEDKIHEELKAKFGIEHSGSTIRKYSADHLN